MHSCLRDRFNGIFANFKIYRNELGKLQNLREEGGNFKLRKMLEKIIELVFRAVYCLLPTFVQKLPKYEAKYVDARNLEMHRQGRAQETEKLQSPFDSLGLSGMISFLYFSKYININSQ